MRASLRVQLPQVGRDRWARRARGIALATHRLAPICSGIRENFAPSAARLSSSIVAFAFALCLALAPLLALAQSDSPRRSWPLLDGWRTAMDQTDRAKFTGFEQPEFNDTTWRTVVVPHNWESYEGVRRLVHGNLHGYAWYRRSFDLPASEAGRRVSLFFEGVGSYATVWVNGQLAGSHAGGRTTFTLDVTALVRPGAGNTLAVRADHPAGITDLPWVCGGCSTQPGFSEGSQPFGLFRPVTLYTTEAVRVVPFGIHVWNDADATAASAKIHLRAELHNSAAAGSLIVTHELLSPTGATLATDRREVTLAAGETTLPAEFTVTQPALWSPESPALHRVVTTLARDGRVLDRVETPFGIRTAFWPAPDAPLPAPFRLNGQPVFLNGTCEYEHNLGASHAFTPEQIDARAAQVRAAGFNAFRDAHQPHNLRYQEHWDRHGILWWTQFASQIWFDTPEFRANFKRLLREWVRERRNSPSLVLWGLANESKLPTDFARECVALIRELDPTSPSQRLVVTCNGGTGTDWNVPQNWTGTYGGDPTTYADDLRRQRLVGEYGAWRSLGLHSEGGFVADGIRSESRHDALLALKIRLAESVRSEVPGHFHWLLVTHENPGRTLGSRGQQGSDGWAPLDRLGPANNKGNFTLWGEPTDAFFLYRASYAPPTDPMVHIVSHTWPDRWDGPGVKDGIEIWSNCEEVELFNDFGARSLGVRRRGGPGVPFRWDQVEIATDTLYAEGRVGGKAVARDLIRLRNLPPAPHRDAWRGPTTVTLAGEPGWNYLYRVNAGGSAFTDSHGQRWLADQDLRPGATWGSLSWAANYPDLPPRFGSQRESFDPVRGTADETLFQTYRYGREQLRFEFPVPKDGDYRVELYFTEPWYGRGGGEARGWRLFDVALNGRTELRDVDLWGEAGYSAAVKKVLHTRAQDGRVVVSFPRVAAGQAVLAGLAIATQDRTARPVTENDASAVASTSVATPAADAAVTWQELPAAAAKAERSALTWRVSFGLGGSHDFALRYSNPTGTARDVEFRVNAPDGSVIDLRVVRLPPSGATSAEVRVSGVGMNAGDYTVTVAPIAAPLVVEALRFN